MRIPPPPMWLFGMILATLFFVIIVTWGGTHP
jgi:hypothetical protein